MKGMWIFPVAIAFTLSGLAKGVQVSRFDPTQLHLGGSYCEFQNKSGETVLWSDWRGKFWLKIDGNLIELVSHQTDDEGEQQRVRRRWNETLSVPGLAVELSLTELERGMDSAAYKGHLEFKRRGSSRRIRITGGCGA